MKKFYEEISENEISGIGEIVRRGENHLVLALDDVLTDGFRIHLVVFKKESGMQLVIMPYVKRILLKQKRYEQIIDKLKQLVEKNKNEFGSLISVYEGAYDEKFKLFASKKII
jgi:hypothetical protein